MRQLWTVNVDHGSVAVVAAPTEEQAWAITAALDEEYDLPRYRQRLDVLPCPPEQQHAVLALAADLGCLHNFLACLRGGMFLTHISSLKLTSLKMPLAA